MAVPREIHRLVERFDENRDAYRSGEYNEAQARVDFINPLFAELGWDIENRQGRPEAYREVVYEDRVKVGGGTKAPDYGFYAAGTRRFFLEAKKPSVDIAGDVAPAVQLRRYAWSARLPLSVLTDFEEFAVYDCRFEPVRQDGPATARLELFTFERYVEDEVWEKIRSTFSREAVLAGSLEKYAEANRRRRGTETVDATFLREIEGWRGALARDLASRNDLNSRQLNFAVQMTIDRIIFLRMAEDRGIEEYGRLLGLTNGGGVYGRLRGMFREADERYNSGLFHFRRERDRDEEPDDLTLSLEISDETLRGIVRGLYYPESPYEFSVLPVDVLGQVYEQFLGKVIRREDTPGGPRAVVEEKPEVRKAGDVYYTPTYIVDYIVGKTVGSLLEGKRPGPRGGASRLKIVDPACGSGSFLIGAYQFLLDWHRDRYVEDGPEKHPNRLYRGPGDQWLLTIDEKKRILLNNIFGVDIDPQAVEVTKLSLLLKVLEGESEASLASQLRMFQERALPDLDNNIKCGNSLIGPDFYDNEQMSFLGEEEHYRINVFDWKAAFPQAFAGDNPGFDAVIGNPPYVLLQDEFRDDNQLSYFRARFSTASYKIDTYHLFIEQSLWLARSSGRCAMITPANFLTNNYLSPLRRLLLERSTIDHIMVIEGGVFKGISVDNAIYVVEAGQETTSSGVVHASSENAHLRITATNVVSSNSSLSDRHVLFTGSSDGTMDVLWDRMREQHFNLGQLADVNFGKQLRNRKQYTSDVVEVSTLDDVVLPYKPCYTGRNASRYFLEWHRLACLDQDVARRGGCWDAQKQDAKRKIVTRQIGQYPDFAIDNQGFQCLNTMFMINLHATDMDALFVLGLLNSKLLRRLWVDRFYDQRKTFPKIKGTYLKLLPIRTIDFSDPEDVARHDRMVGLVERMLSLHEGLAGARIGRERTVIERQISATDRQIDRLVYEFYGLTDDEIAVVEEATGR